jgi:putative selenium metabolism hydrolase
MTPSPEVIAKIKSRVAEQREEIITFLRELCAIPSYNSQIKDVGERAAAEMRKLGFEQIWWDKMGNIVGRIGDGPTKLLYDSHIDTVGIGDPEEWKWDPFTGKIEDGVFFARGACDEKGSTPGMIYGLSLAKELGLLEGITAYYFGNMEEWNDGSAPHAFVVTEGIKPDYVVIGEPTKMQVYRGHKGRVEMKVVAKGKSAHAASNFMGDNAIYKIMPIIDAISKLEPQLGDDPFLGHGRITVTHMEVKTPSLNAVPDEATAYIDRRITFGKNRRPCCRRSRTCSVIVRIWKPQSCCTMNPAIPVSCSRWTKSIRRGPTPKHTRWYRRACRPVICCGAHPSPPASGTSRPTVATGRVQPASPASATAPATKSTPIRCWIRPRWMMWYGRPSGTRCCPR